MKRFGGSSSEAAARFIFAMAICGGLKDGNWTLEENTIDHAPNRQSIVMSPISIETEVDKLKARKERLVCFRPLPARLNEHQKINHDAEVQQIDLFFFAELIETENHKYL